MDNVLQQRRQQHQQTSTEACYSCLILAATTGKWDGTIGTKRTRGDDNHDNNINMCTAQSSAVPLYHSTNTYTTKMRAVNRMYCVLYDVDDDDDAPPLRFFSLSICMYYLLWIWCICEFRFVCAIECRSMYWSMCMCCTQPKSELLCCIRFWLSASRSAAILHMIHIYIYIHTCDLPCSCRCRNLFLFVCVLLGWHDDDGHWNEAKVLFYVVSSYILCWMYTPEWWHVIGLKTTQAASIEREQIEKLYGKN